MIGLTRRPGEGINLQAGFLTHNNGCEKQLKEFTTLEFQDHLLMAALEISRVVRADTKIPPKIYLTFAGNTSSRVAIQGPVS